MAALPSPPVLTPARTRPGRRFEPVAELELEADAVRRASQLPGAHRGLLVFREMVGPFGVPDLVAVVGSAHALEQRRALGVPPLLNQVDAGIVSASAPRARRSVATIARRLGWPEEMIARRLPALIRSGALIRAGRDTFVRPSALSPVGRVYAIETKVRDWRRAVRQGRTYATWCDAYVLAMGPLTEASVDQLIETIAEDGAGLVLEGAWVTRPKITRLSPAQRLWGSEHVVAAATPLALD